MAGIYPINGVLATVASISSSMLENDGQSEEE